jgi:Tfp pilus assembly protein FimV
MTLVPCSVTARAAETSAGAPFDHRIEELERRLAETVRALRRAEAEIALLNDRLAWAEADLAVAAAAADGDDPTALRPAP